MEVLGNSAKALDTLQGGWQRTRQSAYNQYHNLTDIEPSEWITHLALFYSYISCTTAFHIEKDSCLYIAQIG